MTCEECETSVLVGDPPEAGAAEHLKSCEACRAFAAESREALELAAMPPLSAGDRAAMAALPASVEAGWRARQRRRGLFGKVAGYAVAAGLGALVATGALLSRPAHAVADESVDTGPWVTEEADEQPELASDDFDLSS